MKEVQWLNTTPPSPLQDNSKRCNQVLICFTSPQCEFWEGTIAPCEVNYTVSDISLHTDRSSVLWDCIASTLLTPWHCCGVEDRQERPQKPENPRWAARGSILLQAPAPSATGQCHYAANTSNYKEPCGTCDSEQTQKTSTVHVHWPNLCPWADSHPTPEPIGSRKASDGWKQEVVLHHWEFLLQC